MKKKCKKCEKEKRISQFYANRKLCKSCYNAKKDDQLFKCYRCKNECSILICKENVTSFNKIQVGKTFCCRKCLYKIKKKCCNCEKKYWATENTRYCSKCEKIKYKQKRKKDGNKNEYRITNKSLSNII